MREILLVRTEDLIKDLTNGLIVVMSRKQLLNNKKLLNFIKASSLQVSTNMYSIYSTKFVYGKTLTTYYVFIVEDDCIGTYNTLITEVVTGYTEFVEAIEVYSLIDLGDSYLNIIDIKLEDEIIKEEIIEPIKEKEPKKTARELVQAELESLFLNEVRIDDFLKLDINKQLAMYNIMTKELKETFNGTRIYHLISVHFFKNSRDIMDNSETITNVILYAYNILREKNYESYVNYMRKLIRFVPKSRYKLFNRLQKQIREQILTL